MADITGDGVLDAVVSNFGKVEGNDVGEFIPIKRMIGLPVVAVAPQFRLPPSPEAP